MNIKDYRTIPALASYIDRIGAEQLSFRKFMVKEYHGSYYLERADIKLAEDGTVTCEKEEYAPTVAEAKAIKAALANVEFPKSVHATKVLSEKLREKLKVKKKDWFEFVDRSIKGKGNVVMVHQRVSDAEGKYRPWTFFSDGEWRMMEPGGDLPFWVPHKPRLKKMFMVHEGAKAARHVDWLVNDPSKEAKAARKQHPWADELAMYEHWGIIGGALAPHRTDFKMLHREKPEEVVYICDNDPAGQSVLQEFSKHYRHKLRGVRFDGSWPHSFDLAEPMPEEFFTVDAEGRRYWNGGKLRDRFQGATYATEQVVVPQATGRPRIVTKLLKDFAEEWVHVEQPDVYIHVLHPNKLLSKDEFNSRVAPYSQARDTAELLKKIDDSKVAEPDYDPSKKPGIIRDERGRRVNTHVGTKVVAEEGDISLWQEFMEHLIPNERDRHELYRWAYTHIGKPETKMGYGALLVSETQGVGKTTFGEILQHLTGEDNVSYPSETEIVDSQFTSWVARKRLAIMSEIYAGNSSKAYNRLKDKVTDKTVQVHEKFQKPYEMKNWMHILALSNSHKALKLDHEDRRYLIPEVTEKKQRPQWWRKFRHWYEKENGLGKILFEARRWAAATNEPILEGDEAPWTSRKRELIEEQMSEGQQLVMNFLDHVAEEMKRERTPKERQDDETTLANEKQAMGGKGSNKTAVIGRDVIILDTDLRALIHSEIWEGQKTDKLEAPLTIRKIAKGRPDERWHINKNKKFRLAAWKLNDHTRGLIVSSPELADKSAGELSEMGLKPLDVAAVCVKWRKM